MISNKDIKVANLYEHLDIYTLKNYYKAYNKDGRTIVDLLTYGWICWGALLHDIQCPQEFSKLHIDIYKDRREDNINNFCIFTTKEELMTYLTEITQYCHFKFKVSEVSNKFRVTITDFSGSKKELLWILNLIRHTYEFPFNVFLRDAILLRESTEELKQEHLVNLIQVVASSASLKYCLSQSFGNRRRQLVPFIEVLEKLKSSRSKCISTIYNKKSCQKITVLPSSFMINIGGYEHCMRQSFLSYWLLDNEEKTQLKNRFEIYKKNYEILKVTE